MTRSHPKQKSNNNYYRNTRQTLAKVTQSQAINTLKSVRIIALQSSLAVSGLWTSSNRALTTSKQFNIGLHMTIATIIHSDNKMAYWLTGKFVFSSGTRSMRRTCSCPGNRSWISWWRVSMKCSSASTQGCPPGQSSRQRQRLLLCHLLENIIDDIIHSRFILRKSSYWHIGLLVDVCFKSSFRKFSEVVQVGTETRSVADWSVYTIWSDLVVDELGCLDLDDCPKYRASGIWFDWNWLLTGRCVRRRRCYREIDRRAIVSMYQLTDILIHALTNANRNAWMSKLLFELKDGCRMRIVGVGFNP